MTEQEFEEIEITVTWEICDGYISGDRPQETKIKLSKDLDFEDWNIMSSEEKRYYIEDCVQEDFENKITYEIGNYGL